MTEYFRITGLNLIPFDALVTGEADERYRLAGSPRGIDEPLTRQEVLAVVQRLPREDDAIKSHALKRGLSRITFPFTIKGSSDADMEDARHDLTETLEDGKLYIATKGARGTRAILQTKANNAVQQSYKTIFYGEAEEAGGREILGGSIKQSFILNMQMTLYCEPNWRPETAVTLGPNEIYCPSFEEDHDANGRADDWATIGPPAALAMEGTIVLHGCYSQKISTNGAVQGLASAVMVAPAAPANDAIAYVWVCRPAAGTDIRASLRDTTAAADRATADYSAATTTVTVGGYEWRRLELIATNNIVPANNHQLLVYSLAVDVTDWYIDKAFWKWDTTTIPDEWIDHWLIYNHYDARWLANYPGGAIAGDEGHINYVDVDDLKGDVDARLLMQVEFEKAADWNYAADLFVARRTQPEASCFPWWWEAEDANTITNWTITAETACSGGACLSNAANTTGQARFELPVDYPLENLYGRYRVYAVVFTDDPVNTSYRLRSAGYGFQWEENLWKKQDATSEWQLLFLGNMDVKSSYRRLNLNLRYLHVYVEYSKAAPDLVKFDCLWLVPDNEPPMSLHAQLFATSGQWFAVENIGDFEYMAIEASTPPLEIYGHTWIHGGIMKTAPTVENRLYFVCLTRDSSPLTAERFYDCHDPATGPADALEMIVSMEYLPQFVSPLE